MIQTSRRTLFRAFAGAVAAMLDRRMFGEARAEGFLVERLLLNAVGRPGSSRKAHYRADATISLVSIPIYTRRGVGGGLAEIEEKAAGDRSSLCIRFSAGSYPDKAGGVNRLGYIEEVVVERAAVPEESSYFGFMTSSPEQSLDDARKALHESGREEAVYSAAQGHIRQGTDTSRRLKLRSATAHSWAESAQVLAFVNTAFSNDLEEEGSHSQAVPTPATFLYTVLRAAWDPQEESDRLYSYLGKSYRIRSVKRPDPEMGCRFASEGLTRSANSVVSLKGTVVNVDDGKSSRFRLWVEDSGERRIPIRFEYKARSFLRVSFEIDPTLAPERKSPVTPAA